MSHLNGLFRHVMEGFRMNKILTWLENWLRSWQPSEERLEAICISMCKDYYRIDRNGTD